MWLNPYQKETLQQPYKKLHLMFYTATVLQVVARHEDLLAQATGIESLEGKESLNIVTLVGQKASFNMFICIG